VSKLEAVLIFAGIPLGVSVLIAAAVYAGSSSRRSKRYRPGRPFEFRPVWFLSAPETVGAIRPALPAGAAAAEGAARVELTATGRPGNGRSGRADDVDDWPAPGPAGANGGASDRW
jgi:hypothetical protein